MKEIKGKAEFPGPGGTITTFVRKETIFTKEGFGAVPHMYPVTVVQARYNGTYEGCEFGGWLAFPVSADQLATPTWDGWDDSDIECMEWWQRQQDEGWPVGKGKDPLAAYQDLLRIACEGAGVVPSEYFEEPTWNREELSRRHEEDELDP